MQKKFCVQMWSLHVSEGVSAEMIIIFFAPLVVVLIKKAGNQQEVSLLHLCHAQWAAFFNVQHAKELINKKVASQNAKM